MRHRLGLRKLNRTSAHRLAMLRNMMCSLIKHEAIKTTLPKAKELRRVVEPMITLAKEPTVANKRLAFNRLRDREVVCKLFNEIGPRFANRNGGYKGSIVAAVGPFFSLGRLIWTLCASTSGSGPPGSSRPAPSHRRRSALGAFTSTASA